MKLYFSKGSCSLAIRILLYDIGKFCEYEAVNLKTKQTESGQDYYKLNPKGVVPALELDNGEILTENAVIQQYLADHYQATALLPTIGDFKRYRVLEWLNFVTTELHKGCSPLFNAQVPDTIKDEVFKPLLKNKFNIVNLHLAENQYLMGKDYTLPDGYLWVILRWLTNFKIDISDWPNLSRYFRDLKQRPSIQKALKEEV